MSEDEQSDTCCASCGIAEIDDIKLVPCDDCDLVRYCSDECRDDHKSEHEEDCKKRAAELRDELLFKQPESTHLGDCPICCLPMPLDEKESVVYVCCGKTICRGCAIAIIVRGSNIEETSCPFSRHVTKKKERHDKQLMKKVEANDPVALRL